MATISDIAKKAGVSVSTVSHVVNGTRFVSPEKEERVNKAIEELEQSDQLPNFIVKKKRGISSKKRISAKYAGHKYVLILLSEQFSRFQDQVKRSLEEILRGEGLTAISVCYDEDAERLERFRTLFAETEDIAGMVVFPDQKKILTKEHFDKIRIPVVLIGNTVEGMETDVIQPDTVQAAYMAVRHLAKNGHEKIAFLTESDDLTAPDYEGYRKALEDFGFEPDENMAFSGLRTEAAVFSAMDRLTENESGASALVISDSYPLIPVFRYLRKHSIAVPQELSVVSLNDFNWSSLLTPEITCVDNQPEEYARKAAGILIKRINDREAADDTGITEDCVNMKLPSRLLVRSSTCGIGRGPFGEKAESPESLVLSETDKEQIRQKRCTAAISLYSSGKAWVRLQEKGIRKVFEELGISVIAVTDAHSDEALQCRQLESIRFLNPDILISIPADTKETAESYKEMANNGTRLVLIGNVPDSLTPKDYVSCVSVNEHAHGSSMGRGLGEYMEKHGMKNVGFFRSGAKDGYASKQRDAAAEQVFLEEYPGINICGYVEFTAENEIYKKTLEFLKHHPETEAIYVSWDGPALHVIEAMTEAGRSDIAVVTGDLDYPAALNLARGGAVKMLSVQSPYEEGEAIALAAANGLLGNKVPSFIGVEPVSIRQDNLLKNWKDIFREEAPEELRNAVRQNPNHIEWAVI